MDDFNIKLTPVGDGAVGKTSILTSYTQDQVKDTYEPTVFDNYSASVIVNGEKVILNLADTAGQEDFENLRKLCYPNTDVFLVVFSVDSRTSFDNVKGKWIPELQDKKKVKGAHGSPVIVVGNKIDLRKTQTGCVTMEEGKRLVDALKADTKVVSTSVTYMECSALTSDGVKDIFDEAIKLRLIARHKAGKGKKCSIL